MVGGFVSRKGDRISLRLVRIDVENKKVLKTISNEMSATKEEFINRVVPNLTTALLMQPQPPAAAVAANGSTSKPQENRQNHSPRSILRSPFTWIGISAAAVVVGIYYFSRSSKGPSSNDGEIQLNNEPTRNRE
jgi:hypothetical protein